MTRQEYMDALQAQLNFLPRETRDAALAFYGEMIDDRMEDGMDEQSAVAAMEEAEAIAARLRAENPPETKEETAKDAPEPMRDEAMEFSSLAGSVLRAAEEAMKQVPELVNSGMEAAGKAMEQVPDLVNKGVKAAQDAMERARESEQAAGTDGERNGDYEQRILTCPAAALRAISLTASEMPVRVEACEGDDAQLVYYTCPQDPYAANFENGILTLTAGEKAKGRRGFSFSFLADRIQMMWSKPSPTIELHLPVDTLADLTVRTGNGSIRVKNLSALCAVDLHTSNSRIALENVRCKSLEMKSSNGRIVLERVESKSFFRGKTSNSRIEAVRCISGGDMTLTTSNGSISAAGATAREAMTLTTSNASITVEKVDAPAVTLRSSNGSLRGTLPGTAADWAISSGTSNGRNSLPNQTSGRKRLNAHTSNASISLGFEG